MKKILNSRLLGIIPLFILIIHASYLVWVISSGTIGMQNEHIAGLIFTGLSTIAFFILYKPAILFLGFTLILGLCGFISLSPAIRITYFRIGSLYVSFQSIFLLWIIIHVILSGKYYVGVLTKKYWKTIRTKEPLSINDDH